MMRYVYEFEIFKNDGDYLARLFDFDQMTQGDNFEDAVNMAVDLLKFMIEDHIMRGEKLPEPTFDHNPLDGGRLVAVSVDIDLQASENFITAKEAAARLGVTAPRVSHLIRDGLLVGFKDRGNMMISLESLEAYVQKPRKAGRPKNEISVHQ